MADLPFRHLEVRLAVAGPNEASATTPVRLPARDQSMTLLRKIACGRLPWRDASARLIHTSAMLAVVIAYGVIALLFLRGLLFPGKPRPPAAGLADTLNAVGKEREQRESLLRRARVRLDALITALCNAIAWPSTWALAVATLRHRDMREQFRVQALIRLYALPLLLQPVVVLALFGSALWLHAGSEPPDRLSRSVAYALIAYATLYQLNLLVSPKQIRIELKRSLWDPRLKAVAIALVQLACLATAYAALEADRAMDGGLVVAVARDLLAQRHLRSGLFGEAGTSGLALCIAVSGALYAAAILRTAFKFWTLARNDEDRIDIATSQLLASHFGEALRTLEQVRNRSAESELRRGVALLAGGELDGAIRHARHFWSLYTDDEVCEAEAAARLLGGATLFLVPWPAMEALLERCLAKTPVDARLYSSLGALAQVAAAPRDRIAARLQARAEEDRAFGPLRAYYLFGIDRRAEAEAIAKAPASADPVARAVTAHLRIAAPTFEAPDSAERARQTFDRLCKAHLGAFEKACAETRSVGDLEFLIVLASELEGLGRVLAAESLFRTVAVLGKLQERLRLVARAHEYDDHELIRRSVGPPGHSRR